MNFSKIRLLTRLFSAKTRILVIKPPISTFKPLLSFSTTSSRPLFDIHANVDRRLAITFTCKICDERLTRTFLKKSYEEGVVLVRCTKCLNNHIIADNLGWFSDLNGKKFEIFFKKIIKNNFFIFFLI
jgi:hypothetical protein